MTLAIRQCMMSKHALSLVSLVNRVLPRKYGLSVKELFAMYLRSQCREVGSLETKPRSEEL